MGFGTGKVTGELMSERICIGIPYPTLHPSGEALPPQCLSVTKEQLEELHTSTRLILSRAQRPASIPMHLVAHLSPLRCKQLSDLLVGRDPVGVLCQLASVTSVGCLSLHVRHLIHRSTDVTCEGGVRVYRCRLQAPWHGNYAKAAPTTCYCRDRETKKKRCRP